MTAEGKSSYFKELPLNLQHEGFTVGQPEDGLLSVEMEGQRLCRATESGGVRYRQEDVSGDSRGAALDRVTDIAKITAEYMGQMEAAPQLAASGLTGDYRLLADFNDTVLAGHPTQYGVQFVTWERVQNRTALYQGDYHGPGVGIGGYAAAKRDFATRSGLVPAAPFFILPLSGNCKYWKGAKTNASILYGRHPAGLAGENDDGPVQTDALPHRLQKKNASEEDAVQPSG